MILSTYTHTLLKSGILVALEGLAHEGSSHSPASSPRVARITGICHYAQFDFMLFSFFKKSLLR